MFRPCCRNLNLSAVFDVPKVDSQVIRRNVTLDSRGPLDQSHSGPGLQRLVETNARHFVGSYTIRIGVKERQASIIRLSHENEGGADNRHSNPEASTDPLTKLGLSSTQVPVQRNDGTSRSRTAKCLADGEGIVQCRQ